MDLLSSKLLSRPWPKRAKVTIRTQIHLVRNYLVVSSALNIDLYSAMHRCKLIGRSNLCLKHNTDSSQDNSGGTFD